MHINRILSLGLGVALTLIGCDAPVGPGTLTRASVAADYELVLLGSTPIGELPGQATGYLRLDERGGVERRTVFRSEDGSEFVTTVMGRYALQDSRVQFELVDGGYLWRPMGSITGSVVTISYPSPSDGPDIVEVYQRR